MYRYLIDIGVQIKGGLHLVAGDVFPATAQIVLFPVDKV